MYQSNIIIHHKIVCIGIDNTNIVWVQPITLYIAYIFQNTSRQEFIIRTLKTVYAKSFDMKYQITYITLSIETGYIYGNNK